MQALERDLRWRLFSLEGTIERALGMQFCRSLGEMYGCAVELIDSARMTVGILGDLDIWDNPRLLAALQAAKERGVVTRMAVYGPGEPSERLCGLKEEGSFTLQPLEKVPDHQVVVVDRKDVMIRGPSSPVAVVRFNAPDMAAGQDVKIRQAAGGLGG